MKEKKNFFEFKYNQFTVTNQNPKINYQIKDEILCNV